LCPEAAVALPRLGELSWRRLLPIIVGLATPIVLASLSQTLMGLVDTLMVGRLGEAALAAVGVSTLLFSATAMSIKSVDVAVQTYTAHRVGEGRDGEVGAVLATAVGLTFAVGTVFMLVGLLRPDALMRLVAVDETMLDLGTEYLRWRYAGMLPLLLYFQLKGMFDGIGWTRIGMVTGIGMNVLNAVLNWVLIFGKLGAPALGVVGAAVASTLSTATAALVILGCALWPRVRKRFRILRRDSIQPQLLRPFLALGWPPALQTLGIVLLFLIFYWILGRISVIAVAAGNVVMRIAALSFMPGIGVGAAVQTLVGQSLGRGDRRGARRAAWGGVGVSVAFMGAFGLVFLLAPGALIRAFSASADLEAAGVPILRVMGLVQVVDAVGLTLAGALRGAGATRAVMLVDLVTGFGLLPPLTYVFGIVLGGGLLGAWWALLTWFTVHAAGMMALFMKSRWREVRL
jgi:putative MATE family efflux protein